MNETAATRSLRFRLLQARHLDDPVLDQEQEMFACRLGVARTAVIPWDLLAGGTTVDAVTSGVDAVLVGGSGAFSVYDGHAWIDDFFATMKGLAERQFPTFASCFGFQGMVMALGGEVGLDSADAEIGTYELTRMAPSEGDPLFGHLPERFLAQLGHKDRALRLPSGVSNLLRSERCPFQCIKVGDGLVYATQFHPELTGPENHARFSRYLPLYAQVFGWERAQHMLDHGFHDSPHTADLLQRFAALVAAR